MISNGTREVCAAEDWSGTEKIMHAVSELKVKTGKGETYES
jgi:hypothetical protein